MTVKAPVEEIQLQMFDGKAYVPTGDTAYTGASGEFFAHFQQLARIMMINHGYKGFRIAKVSRPLKPKYVAPRSTTSSRSVEDVQQDYLRWAESKGLRSIHIGNRIPLNSSPKREYRNSAGDIVTMPACKTIFAGDMLSYVEYFEETTVCENGETMPCSCWDHVESYGAAA